MYQLYPEYEFFTGVEIKFSVDGDSSKEFIISKLGEYFQGLTVREGSLTGGTQLTSPNGGSIASGTVTLIDEDNAIFMSLLASKSQEGNPLLNKLDITINTYTGSKSYLNCRVDKWDCKFNGGVPTIELSWQCVGGSSSPSTSNPNLPAFNASKIKDQLIDVGVTDFKEFKQAIQSSFNEEYRFVYSKTREYSTNSLVDINDDGSLVVFENAEDTKGSKGYIFIPEKCKQERDGTSVYRMELKGKMDNYSFLQAILAEFCKTAKITLKKDSEQDALQLGFRIIDGNNILFFSFIDLRHLTIPEPDGTAQILNDTVFIYNSSAEQGSKYKTPLGEKRVFVIDEISTSFGIKDVIMTHLNNQGSNGNVNGNMIITSRGAITIPDKVPQALAQTIQNLSSLSLTQDIKVTITVYNFIHFFCFGETSIYIIVFDHLGRIHPLSGRMKVGSYTYTIGQGGVIAARVELTPVFSNQAEDYSLSLIGKVSGSDNPPITSTSPSSTNTASASLGYSETSSVPQGSYVNTGMTLDSAIDYTIQKKE